MATIVPTIRHDEEWKSPSVDTWRVQLRTRLRELEVLPVWAATGDVPSAPRPGEIGLVTYGPASGDGIYYYDGTNWLIVTASIGALP